MKLCIPFVLLCLANLSTFGDDPPKAPVVKEPALREELLKRTKTDQEARFALINFMKANDNLDMTKLSQEKQVEYMKLSEAVGKADQENTKWLKAVIEKHGWPTFTLVGKDGAQSAWLLVQHADADPKFQRQCLDLMIKQPKTEVSLSNLAYLTDRVLLAEGKKQLYGTQFIRILGKSQPRPLEDEENVDKRRAEMGLSTLADYAKIIEQQYGSNKKK
ncbi:MAG TPA: hypothetical protein PLN21_17425 [Gemmatales bacterium]|nr:hypothetical protein [Gemmatales bacterium]